MNVRGRGRGPNNTGTQRPTTSSNGQVLTPANRNLRSSGIDQSANFASSVDSPTLTQNRFPCGICKVEVGEEDSVECTKCSTWTHQGCSGLTRNVFDVIAKNKNKGVTYVCTTCRLSKPSSGKTDPAGVLQLLETVKELASSVRLMSEEIKNLQSVRAKQTTNVPAVLPNSLEIKKILHDEAREIREREKRAKSIIIRGLGDQPGAVRTGFNDVVAFLFNGVEGGPRAVELSEIVPINSNLVRAKLTNDVLRRDILDRAKNIKGSQFDGVYVKRDLTFNQRSAMKARFQVRDSSNSGVVRGGSNLTGSTSTPSSTPSRDASAARVNFGSAVGGIAGAIAPLLSDQGVGNLTDQNSL